MHTADAIFPCALGLAIAAALLAGDAEAVERTRWFRANATSFCQSALPVFDGKIRKRPLAVQNEGSANAFVTCSFTGQVTGLIDVAVFAINNTDVTVSLTCTAVTGGVSTDNTYNTKTITIPAFGIQGVGWVGEDYGGGPDSMIPGFGLFNVSCNLLPGVGLARAQIEFKEEVGV